MAGSNARDAAAPLTAPPPAKITKVCLIEERSPAFLEDYLTPTERRLAERSVVDRDLWANIIWSAKESVLKLRREGLRADPRSVCLHPADETPSAEWRRFTVDFSAGRQCFAGWWRREGSWVMTLATEPVQEAPIDVQAVPG